MTRQARLAAATAALILAVSAGPVWAAAPSNDDIGSPTVVGAIPYTEVQDTTEATTGATDPDCYGTGPTVWFSFTPSEGGWYAFDTFGSDYDTTLAVGISDGTGGVDVIACNDDAFGVQSRVILELDANQAYLAVVGSFGSGPGGALRFNVDATEEPVILELTASINPTGQFFRDGSARVSGTVACSVEAYGYLWIEVTQQVGRFTVLGYADMGFECSPDGQTWQLDIQGITGRFGGGNASVRLGVEAYSPIADSYDFEELDARVRLAR